MIAYSILQYADSMVKPLTTIALAMACYSEGYEQNSTFMKLASSMYGGSKYIINPELRAQQVRDVVQSFGKIRYLVSVQDRAREGVRG